MWEAAVRVTVSIQFLLRGQTCQLFIPLFGTIANAALVLVKMKIMISAGLFSGGLSLQGKWHAFLKEAAVVLTKPSLTGPVKNESTWDSEE